MPTISDNCHRLFEKRFELRIPLPLPTWNAILTMRLAARMRLNAMIHHAVSESIRYGTDWPTVTVFRGKPVSTDWFRQEYLRMIRRGTCRVSRSVRKSAIPRKR